MASSQLGATARTGANILPLGARPATIDQVYRGNSSGAAKLAQVVAPPVRIGSREGRFRQADGVRRATRAGSVRPLPPPPPQDARSEFRARARSDAPGAALCLRMLFAEGVCQVHPCLQR